MSKYMSVLMVEVFNLLTNLTCLLPPRNVEVSRADTTTREVVVKLLNRISLEQSNSLTPALLKSSTL